MGAHCKTLAGLSGSHETPRTSHTPVSLFSNNKPRTWMTAHIHDDEDGEDYESLPNASVAVSMTAGALAGSELFFAASCPAPGYQI